MSIFKCKLAPSSKNGFKLKMATGFGVEWSCKIEDKILSQPEFLVIGEAVKYLNTSL